jgi:hypothetical protein
MLCLQSSKVMRQMEFDFSESISKYLTGLRLRKSINLMIHGDFRNIWWVRDSKFEQSHFCGIEGLRIGPAGIWRNR